MEVGMMHLWTKWYVKTTMAAVVGSALLVVWFVALKPTYTGDELLAMLPQCREISEGLEQDWEEVQQGEATRVCYQEGSDLFMQVRWFKTESKAELDFDQSASWSVESYGRRVDQSESPWGIEFYGRQYEASSTWIWNPKSNNVTKHATFYGEEIRDHLSETCVGEVTHSVLAKTARLVIDVQGRGTGVWVSPCLADDLIDGDAQPELVNQAMDMIIRRLDH